MIKRIILSFTILLSISNFAIAQRLVKLNMLEKSPLSNMVVYSTNDSTARYTKLLAGTGIQINYNEGDTTLTIIATGTSVGVPQTLSIDNATRELSISDGNTVDLSESIQDEVATLLQAGTNVTLTYDDVANTLTISTTGGGGGASNLGDLGDVTLTSVSTGQVLKYNGAEWINAVDSGIALTDLSVTTNAAGSAALTYNNTNGVFSFTPPDLSSYLTSAQLANLTDVDTSGLANEYILKYNSSTQEWEVKVNNIDGLTDGYKDANLNLYLGAEPISINPGASLARFNVSTGNRALEKIASGYDNTVSGVSSGVFLQDGLRNTISGRSAFGGYLQSDFGITTNYGNENVISGAFAGARDSLSNGVVYIGAFANENYGTLAPSVNYNSIFIGRFAQSNRTRSYEEIAIGAYVAGKGDSTVVIGRPLIKNTYLNGTMNFNGYGAGNKEASDLSKTGSGYFLEVATDGTLIESTVTGGSAQTLSFDDATRELSISSGNTIDLSEGIQDEIAATVTAGEGITLTYDDVLGTLTVAAPAGAGNTDEQTLSINNATAELSISNGNTVDLSEAIDNQVDNLFVDGTNILSTYDDISNSLTVRTTDALTQIDAITFDNNVTDAVTSRLQYNADVGTFVAGMANNVPIKIGQDIGFYVKNNTASTIPKGTAVMAVGADGNSGIMLIDEMVFDGSQDAKYFIGVTAEAITSGSNGFVISQGVLKGYDTSLISPGSVLYGDPTTPGGFVTTEPTGTNLKLPIANTLSQTNNGTIAIRVHTGLYMKDLHDVDITGVTNNSILKYNSTGGYWDIATDLIDDADADPTNELQDLSLSGNTLSLSADATTVDLSPYLDEATTASNGLTLSGTDVKLGGTLSDATTTIDMNSNALTFTNNGGYNLSGTGGLSFTNTSATDYSSVLSIAPTNTRIYADGGTTEPLNSLNLTSTRSGVKELDLRSSVSNDNTTYTMIALNPTRFSMKTPNVTDLTATNGQFLKLVDRLTGEVEFADALTAEVDGSVTNEIQDLSLSGNTLSLSSDATTVDLSTYLDESTTASNGLTLSGSDVKLGGTLSEITNISMAGFNASIYDVSSNTGFAIQPSSNLIVNYGTQAFDDYGSGNKEAADLSKTKSNYKAAFATDGTLIEVDDIDAMVIACSDETTDITTGTAKVTFRAPHAMTITGVRASLTTASSSGNPTVDINEGGTSILGTKLTIDANEKTSTTAATAATITDTAIADDAEITIDIDAAGTGATGLKVTILYRKN